MQRFDLLLVERGLAQSRTHAQRLIKNGQVEVNEAGRWISITKPGIKLQSDTEFRVEHALVDTFVSRGALKLLGALEHLKLDLTGKVAIDIGQSTGGFTDCLLQHGVAKVVGIEVGHDQLADKLRQDPRVVCYEGINARELPAETLLAHATGNGFDLAVMDVSFISQTKILPSLIPILAQHGLLISLVKPQFEVGKSGVGSGGIVRDQRLFPQVQQQVSECCEALGMAVIHYAESPIKGGDGNREFLMVARKLTLP